MLVSKVFVVPAFRSNGTRGTAIPKLANAAMYRTANFAVGSVTRDSNALLAHSAKSKIGVPFTYEKT